MIIWIDGATGVGKSHVASMLERKLKKQDALYIESDQYWNDFVQNDIEGKYAKGCYPYNNKYFLEDFRKILNEMIYSCKKIPIVSLSLTNKLCKSELLEYFGRKNLPMLHVILEAEKITIKSRIQNDTNRSKTTKMRQINTALWQLKYLNNEYPNAMRINTNVKTFEEIINEIIIFFNSNF